MIEHLTPENDNFKLATENFGLTAPWWHRLAASRAPDEQIGGAERPYMRRWWLARSRLFSVYLHQIVRSDDDRALHDHPAANLSILLEGSYNEWRFARNPRRAADRHGYAYRLMLQRLDVRSAGDWVWRLPSAAHRLELRYGDPVWTLFIMGPRVRQWGFYCPKGWVHWRDFTNPADGGATVGKGCE